ncbi:glycosyl transferase [Bifidobacterium hapali]|uniref:Glycosyl transferase n=1 Tax=Bifidobacterium hapali TaxID=1630172 RepID=A0A261G2J2_9BIFI|nr:glycosyltransferase family 2 protein [Bifidobacterium hapali]OZG65393.1 glycosyl transferase [Bifidobacterium hapali]
MTFVSVLVPVYNVEKYVDECLRSIQNQTFVDFEVVIVNDGSTDKSKEICEKYVSSDKRFHLYSQSNMGLASARNTSLRYARSEYVAFVDSDDYIDPDYLFKLVEVINKYKVDISICNKILSFDSGKRIVESNTFFSNKVITPSEALRALNSWQSFNTAVWGKLFKRSLFDGISFPAGKLSEDAYVIFELFGKAKNGVYFRPDALYYYRQRAGSIQNAKSINDAPLVTSSLQLNYIKKNFSDILYAGETAYVISRMGIFNECIKRGINLHNKYMKNLVNESRPYILAIVFNKDLTRKKKLQALFFVFTPFLYIFLVKKILLSRSSL